MTTQTGVQIDFIDQVIVEENTCGNELRSLRTLTIGLMDLCAFVKRREVAFEKANGGKLKVMMYGAMNQEEQRFLDVTACMFHWFGLSLCNFVRLVGFIRGLHKGEFARSDLTDKKGAEKAKKAIDAYVASVTEIGAVRIWRNKVFAHFAITDPYKDDNVSTLDMSVVFPVSFDGRYVVGGMTMTRSNASGTFTSDLPCWSMTEVFESLIPRYWPGLSFHEQIDKTNEPTFAAE